MGRFPTGRFMGPVVAPKCPTGVESGVSLLPIRAVTPRNDHHPEEVWKAFVSMAPPRLSTDRTSFCPGQNDEEDENEDYGRMEVPGEKLPKGNGATQGI